jgi:hypothetical protein
MVNTRRMPLRVATVLNFMRVAAWLADIPRARTRPSAFAALAAVASSQEARRRVCQRHLVKRQPPPRGGLCHFFSPWFRLSVVRLRARVLSSLPSAGGPMQLPRILTRIRRGRKAGVLMPDGAMEAVECGTPQGGSISVLLSNIYLHYVLD